MKWAYSGMFEESKEASVAWKEWADWGVPVKQVKVARFCYSKGLGVTVDRRAEEWHNEIYVS